MKNTLKVVLIAIGLGFLGYSLVGLFTMESVSAEERRQFYGMLGVGFLFLIGGTAMGKR